MKKALLLFILLFLPLAALAAPGLPAVTVTTAANGAQTYTLSIQILLIMTLLSLLPAGLLMMTAFTRIIIVLALLRQALGTMQTPTNQTLVGLALFLTLFVMAPVFDQAYKGAIEPYMNDQLTPEAAFEKATGPFKTFMLAQTRESDIQLFADISGKEQMDTPQSIPLSLLVPSFITSELKTAFQIGFLIFIPFLIIDLVVASILMAMGMMMLSPMIISLPFKIMLFVLVDGWALIMGTLAASFNTVN